MTIDPTISADAAFIIGVALGLGAGYVFGRIIGRNIWRHARWTRPLRRPTIWWGS